LEPRHRGGEDTMFREPMSSIFKSGRPDFEFGH